MSEYAKIAAEDEGRQGKKTVRTCDNLSKNSLQGKKWPKQRKYTQDMIKGRSFGGMTHAVIGS